MEASKTPMIPQMMRALQPLTVLINQYQLSAFKYKRDCLYDGSADIANSFEFLALSNDTVKKNVEGMIGSDPYCKLSHAEVNSAIQNCLDLLVPHYIGGLKLTLTSSPRKSKVRIELEDGASYSLSYTTRLT